MIVQTNSSALPLTLQMLLLCTQQITNNLHDWQVNKTSVNNNVIYSMTADATVNERFLRFMNQSGLATSECPQRQAESTTCNSTSHISAQQYTSAPNIHVYRLPQIIISWSAPLDGSNASAVSRYNETTSRAVEQQWPASMLRALGRGCFPTDANRRTKRNVARPEVYRQLPRT